MRAISSITHSSHCGPRKDSGSSPEKNTHTAPFGHSSLRSDDTQRGARITAAGREDAALAFEIDVVEIGRGRRDQMDALDAGSHCDVNRRRHRMGLAGATTNLPPN